MTDSNKLKHDAKAFLIGFCSFLAALLLLVGVCLWFERPTNEQEHEERMARIEACQTLAEPYVGLCLVAVEAN